MYVPIRDQFCYLITKTTDMWWKSLIYINYEIQKMKK